MDRRNARMRHGSAAMLLAGLVLALITPLQVARVAPSLAGSLRHPVLLAAETVPYVLCALLWLPRRSDRAAACALIIAASVLIATAIVCIPELRAAGTRGGDMVGLAYFGTAAVLTLVVVLESTVAYVILRWGPNARRRPERAAGCRLHLIRLDRPL